MGRLAGPFAGLCLVVGTIIGPCIQDQPRQWASTNTQLDYQLGYDTVDSVIKGEDDKPINGTCTTCNGTGYVGDGRVSVECQDCGGDGKIDGNEAVQATAKICPCSGECSCGCNNGQPCTCGNELQTSKGGDPISSTAVSSGSCTVSPTGVIQWGTPTNGGRRSGSFRLFRR